MELGAKITLFAYGRLLSSFLFFPIYFYSFLSQKELHAILLLSSTNASLVQHSRNTIYFSSDMQNDGVVIYGRDFGQKE